MPLFAEFVHIAVWPMWHIGTKAAEAFLILAQDRVKQPFEFSSL
jgi:hypothetical protein